VYLVRMISPKQIFKEATVKKLSIHALGLILISLWFTAMALGQATTSLKGTVSDMTGGVIPGVTVTLTNPATGTARTALSGADGGYSFAQVLPGTYNLSVEATGFDKYLQEGLPLLVNTPTTVNITLEVGKRTQTISVVGEAPVLNTSDATVGVALSGNQIKELPMQARDVAGLYSLQPGVVFLGTRDDINYDMDTRSGAVNGAHSDQSNFTLDGVSVNDQGGGHAFQTVLRMNPDAIQEFRVTTSNYNADEGRSSGAQVVISTKGGTNNFHGLAYEYARNTVTSANDWFIKQAEITNGQPNKAPKLIRNIFGGNIGGPIKKDRAFFFLDFDGRRDSQEVSVVQTVPTATLRQGIIRYQNDGGGVTTLTPADIAAMDPLGIGPSAVSMAYFQTFPLPNDNSVGDGLNYSGFRFAGKVHRRFDTYLGRFDWNLNSNGNQRLFFRGNLQPYDYDSGAPFLPGIPYEANEDFTKGLALGYTAVMSPTLINTLTWGLTRQSHAILGSSNLPWIYMRGLSQGVSRSSGFILTDNNIVDNLNWQKGTHALSFGTNLDYIRNPRKSLANSFSDCIANGSWTADAGFAGTGDSLDPTSSGFPGVNPDFANSYDFPLIALLGMCTEIDATYNYDKTGALLAQGAPTVRHFAANEFEFYGQDEWRMRPNLTITYGLRWEMQSPPWETTGLQVAPNVNMSQWFQQRQANMNAGIPSNQDPLISFDLAGPANGKPGFYPYARHNLAPRLSVAYSPRPSSGLLNKIFGDNKTSIRAGFGIVYDHIGQGLLNSFDTNGSFGLSTQLSNPAGVQTPDCAPRITSINVIPTTGCDANGNPGANIFVPAPPGGFPQTPPSTLDTGGFAIAWGLDNTIRTPYSYMIDFSIQRELAHNMSLEVSYVGHLSHRLLVQEDLAMPLNFRDPKSGVDYFTATAALSKIGDACPPASAPCTPNVTSASVSPAIAQYWADILGPAPAGGYPYGPGSATTPDAVQAAYDLFSDPADGYLYNETTGQFVLDLFGYPSGPSTGLNTFYNPQYSSLYAWRSIGNASYHGLEVSLQKRYGHGVNFGLNYTFSKSIDLMSDAYRIGAWGGLGGQVINSWDYKAMRAVSDFDTTHQVNANWVVELPFGKGRAFGRNAGGVVNAIIGGWQTSGLYRWTSGFPVNIFNGYLWPTNWELGGQAMLNGPAPATQTTKNGDGTVNMFANPSTAIGAFRHPLPGESGNRNVIRGDGFFGWDQAVEKSWKMPFGESQTLRFRWEIFNVPNANRFNVQSNPPELDQVSAFGNYTGLLTDPRVMQFALRYEF
jgi:Carboxypeptidase regulatory-like domain